MALPQVSLEKRILPLLDITLILVGILLVVMGTPELGQDRVFTVPLVGEQIVYEGFVIFNGDTIEQSNVEQMLRIANSGGFSNVIIELDPESELSAMQMMQLEKDLQRISQSLAMQESWLKSITIHMQ